MTDLCGATQAHLPVTPFARVCLEGVCYPGRQRTGWSCHHIAVRVGDISPPHRYNLSDDPKEGLLESDGDTNQNLGGDQGVDAVCVSTNDAADQSDAGSDNEEP